MKSPKSLRHKWKDISAKEHIVISPGKKINIKIERERLKIKNNLLIS